MERSITSRARPAAQYESRRLRSITDRSSSVRSVEIVRSDDMHPILAPTSEAASHRPSKPSRTDHRQKDRKSTRLNSSHSQISYAVFCLKKKIKSIVNHTRS